MIKVLINFSIIKLVGNAVTWLANGKTPVIATHTSDLVIFENFFVLYLQFHNPFSLITRPINSARYQTVYNLKFLWGTFSALS
jgi:hypothetical protein